MAGHQSPFAAPRKGDNHRSAENISKSHRQKRQLRWNVREAVHVVLRRVNFDDAVVGKS